MALSPLIIPRMRYVAGLCGAYLYVSKGGQYCAVAGSEDIEPLNVERIERYFHADRYSDIDEYVTEIAREVVGVPEEYLCPRCHGYGSYDKASAKVVSGLLVIDAPTEVPCDEPDCKSVKANS